jgi:flagellar motor switch protein FliG
MTIKNAAAILANLSQPQIKVGIDTVSNHDPHIANEILDHLFTFEDLLYLSNVDLQSLLLHLSDREITICMKKVSKELGIKIVISMPKSRAKGIAEDFQDLEKIKQSDVESMQLEVMRKAYRMHEEKNLTLRKKPLEEKYL